jgi:hypothetical protein
MKDILITMQQYNEIDDSYKKSLENFLNEPLENIIENYKNNNKEQNNIEDDLSL